MPDMRRGKSPGSAMVLPPNIQNPLFAYGVFKPGQLGFFQIKGFVRKVEEVTIAGVLKEKDGIPLFLNQIDQGSVDGYLLFPLEGKEQEFYDAISKMEPVQIYRWDILDLPTHGSIEETVRANVLTAKELGGGTNDIERKPWDGRNDPLFSVGFDEVRRALVYSDEGQEEKPNSSRYPGIFFEGGYRKLLRCNMAYLLLWMIIERYLTLRYGIGETSKKNRCLSAEPAFKEALKHIVTSEGEKIFPSDGSRFAVLDASNPGSSISYYYKIRCNVTHRGKAVLRDMDRLQKATEQLLKIMEKVLKASWEEAQQIKKEFVRSSLPNGNFNAVAYGENSDRLQSAKLYFAYGSNLWKKQMEERCPEHRTVGLGILKGYRWIINTRGYANIVKSKENMVYGLVYEISVSDEATLDREEGVPIFYQKEYLGVSVQGQILDCLIYVASDTEEGSPKKEYIERIIMGIGDADLPGDYVECYVNPFIQKPGNFARPENLHNRRVL